MHSFFYFFISLFIDLQIAYLLAIFCYLIKESRNIYKQGLAYFTRFWSYVELFIIIGSIAATAAYILMIINAKAAIAEFSRTHGNIFMNFQLLAYWSENLTYLCAVICFFALLKLVRLFRFNQRVGSLGAVLHYAAEDLKHFALVFLIMFTAFVLVFYLLYTDTLVGFRTFLTSLETSMQIILGKFDFTSMYEREMILGPLLFAGFSLFVIFIMVSMFVAILNDSFRRVMQDFTLQSDDYEATQFILSQFLSWTGLSRTKLGRQLMGDTVGSNEFTYDPEQEPIKKIGQLTQLMDEFLDYIQKNQISETQKDKKKPKPSTSQVTNGK